MEIQVVLDKPASEDITIEYALQEQLRTMFLLALLHPADYEVVTDYLEIEIPKGETTGIIELDLLF